MQSFDYKAIDSKGRIGRGQLDALNLIDLEKRLQQEGLDLIVGSPSLQSRAIGIRQITRRDLIEFCFHIEQLLRAGVPLVDSIIDIRDTVDKPYFRKVLSGLVEGIEGGKTLSRTMSDYSSAFDPVFISLIRVGEETGNLPKVLGDLVESLKWQDELASQAKKLALYPAMLCLVMVGLVAFMMGYLVPKLEPFMQGFGSEMPVHTKLLITVSSLFVDYWYLIIGVPITLMIVGFILFRVSDTFHLSIDRIKISLPVIGGILKKIALTRFVSTLSLVYSSGLSVIQGVQMGSSVTGNLAISRALSLAIEFINNGDSLSASFEKAKLFPPLVLRMLKVGEAAGNLDESLNSVTYFYTRDVREAIEKMPTVIGTVLTIFIGAVMGWIMISVLGPVYETITNIDL